MSGAVKAVKNVFSGGGGASDAASQAVARQDKELRKREKDLAATEAGQRRARSSNRGLLAFIDDQLNQALG